MSSGSGSKEELDQILNDIEELQQELEKNQAPELKLVLGGKGDVGASAEAVEVDALSEFRSGSTPESSLDDLADLKDDSEGSGTSLLDEVTTSEEEVEAAEAVVEEVTEEIHSEEVAEEMPEETEEFMMDESVDSDSMTQDGTLTMKLQGQMTLRIQYEFEGQEVVVGLSDGCLKVQLADGTEFKLPLSARSQKPAKLKKVA